jgi:hypothetical protein
MKTIFSLRFLQLLSVILISIGFCNNVFTQTGQFKLIDKTFTWDENTGGDGCFGYHFWEDMGDATSTNWKSPYDFQNGLFYFRYEVISQPELSGGGYQPFQLSFCIWSDYGFEPGKWKENCSSRSSEFNGPGSVVAFSESPAVWWAKEWGGIDWTNMSKLWRFGNPFWYNSTYLLASPYCTNAPPEMWENERDKFFPMQLRITIVAVAQGQTFLGWDHYLNGGTVLKQPTPTYGIDYINERTNKTVPSSDEYALNASMTSAVSGNGSAVALAPGSTVYFREKANGDTLASDLQQLNIPTRPAAPMFVWDQANNRTSTVVSSEYEYSASPSMSGAITGTGNYVNIPAGSYIYFRKKATGSSFKSNIQALQAVAVVSIGPEFVILNEVIDYPNTTDNNGFYFFPHNESMPVNWLTPYNYYNGQIYTRYEIISQPTSTAVGLQFGIWQRLPVGSANDADLHESMAAVLTLNGPGSVATANSSPGTYWVYHDGVDYSQMNNVWHFGINPWKVTPNAQIRQENADVWAERNTYWFPMKVRVTVVAVASGYTFSGWQNYVGDGTSPNYQIDFAGERTSANVVSTDEYSTDQMVWTTGTNAKIPLVPGQTLYFRRKVAPSFLQQLIVPARPASPAFTIEYLNERTAEAISAAYEYSASSNMTGATAGTGQAITLVPGSPMHFRAFATGSAFSSNIQTLNVPARPTGPAVSINYVMERTAENIPTAVEYSDASNFASKSVGTGTTISLTPGTTIYFRTLASTSRFLSSATTLNIPARPAAPAFDINFTYERTSSAISNDYEYSLNSDMSSVVSGSNASVIVTPGTDLYLRRKATSSAYVSSVQHLVVPGRPAAPDLTIDYASEKTDKIVTSAVHYANNPGFTTIHEGTGVQVNLTPGTDMYFRFKATDISFTSNVQMLDVPERPVITTQMINPTAESPLLFDIQFPCAVAGFDSSDLQVINGTICHLNGSFTAGVTPSCNGLIGIMVKAASVEPANFASLPISLTYNGATAVDEFDQNAIVLYPNLASSVITVKGDGLTGCSYRIINIDGVSLASGIFEFSGREINVSALSPGVYHLVILKNGKDKALRFVKQGK